MKATVLVLSLLLCAVILSSCTTLFASNMTDVPVIKEEQIPTSVPIDSVPVKTIKVDYSINYYDVLDDQWKNYSSSEEFTNEIDPVFFINKISELMGINITINSIVTDNGNMTVDFSSASAPVSQTGSYEEQCILECISETLFGVFNDIDRIYITSDGKEYDSGHILLSPDTPYATRQSEKLG